MEYTAQGDQFAVVINGTDSALVPLMSGQSIGTKRTVEMYALEADAAARMAELGADYEPAPKPEPGTVEQVNEERERRLEADFLFGSKMYQADRISIQRITGAATLAGFAMGAGALAGDLRWANPDRDFGWIASDNTVTAMDAQTTFAFGQTAAGRETSIVFGAKNLREMDPIPHDYRDDRWWP